MLIRMYGYNFVLRIGNSDNGIIRDVVNMMLQNVVRCMDMFSI